MLSLTKIIQLLYKRDNIYYYTYSVFIIILFFVIITLILYWGFLYFMFKIKSRFWSIQPVYHLYDFHYFFYKPQIIMNELPQKNTYIDFKNTKYISINDVEDYSKNKEKQHYINSVIKLIQDNYYSNTDKEFKENKYHPDKLSIISYLENNSKQSFITMYFNKQYDINHSIKQDNNNTGIIETNELSACITSKIINIFFKNNTFIQAYYADNMVIDKKHRKKGIAEKLIQTHLYYQMHGTQSIKVSLFKREGNLTGIIPLTVYKTYAFNMKIWNIKNITFNHLKIIECNSHNIHLYNDFIKRYMDMQINNSFEIFIYTDYSNLLHLINTGNIFIWMVIFNNEIVAIYYFRKTCTLINNKEEFISLFASIKLNDELINTSDFIYGFKTSLKNIVKKYPQFTTLLLENISNNNIILDFLIERNKPLFSSNTSFFLYNYIYPSVNSNNIIIIY